MQAPLPTAVATPAGERAGEPLPVRLDRALALCELSRGKPVYITVLLLANHSQAVSTDSILRSLSAEGLPAGSHVDVRTMVMPDASGGFGALTPVLREAELDFRDLPNVRLHTAVAEPPYRRIHYLFAYGRFVNAGIEASRRRLAQMADGHPERFNHIVVRISGDVVVHDRQILAKLVRPLNDPGSRGICVSSAIQKSDWARDELVRRWLVKPRMEACLASGAALIECTSSAPQGSLSAYLAPMLTEIGVSETWGGGEDGVGFTLLDGRIRGAMVRDAVVEHCHAGRSLLLQLQVLGEWVCTGIVNRLNGLSGRIGDVDQTRAYRYFMTHGILGDRSRQCVKRLGPWLGHTNVIHALRCAHTLAMVTLMSGPLLRACFRRRPPEQAAGGPQSAEA